MTMRVEALLAPLDRAVEEIQTIMQKINHAPVRDPKNLQSQICTSCKMPFSHPVHAGTAGSVVVIHGTATPTKIG